MSDTIFNANDGREPDWRLFDGFEIGLCAEYTGPYGGLTERLDDGRESVKDIRAMDPDATFFYTVYGRLKEGMAEALHDTEPFEPEDEMESLKRREQAAFVRDTFISSWAAAHLAPAGGSFVVTFSTKDSRGEWVADRWYGFRWADDQFSMSREEALESARNMYRGFKAREDCYSASLAEVLESTDY